MRIESTSNMHERVRSRQQPSLVMAGTIIADPMLPSRNINFSDLSEKGRRVVVDVVVVDARCKEVYQESTNNRCIVCHARVRVHTNTHIQSQEHTHTTLQPHTHRRHSRMK